MVRERRMCETRGVMKQEGSKCEAGECGGMVRERGEAGTKWGKVRTKRGEARTKRGKARTKWGEVRTKRGRAESGRTMRWGGDER